MISEGTHVFFKLFMLFLLLLLLPLLQGYLGIATCYSMFSMLLLLLPLFQRYLGEPSLRGQSRFPILDYLCGFMFVEVMGVLYEPRK